MEYEVELKFPLKSADQLQRITARLELDFSPGIVQVDRYFNHPSRDFRKTDEAFRLRQIGERNFVTYKGPRIDQQTKTRKELELDLPNGTSVVEHFSELWIQLGFRHSGTVCKTRREASFIWNQRGGHVAHDRVEELGEFVELEFMATEDCLDEVRADALELAAQLDLQESETRSYLELLLALQDPQEAAFRNE